MSSAGFRTDRRQQERFTTRIRNVILEYPWGLGVIKEFLANADDAGAAHFAVIFDKRQHTKVNISTMGGSFCLCKVPGFIVALSLLSAALPAGNCRIRES